MPIFITLLGLGLIVVLILMVREMRPLCKFNLWWHSRLRALGESNWREYRKRKMNPNIQHIKNQNRT